MKRILLIAVCLVCIAGPASAYGLYLDCPKSVQAGLPLKCSIDSDLPAGYTCDIVLYRSQYTATELSRQPVTIQDDHNTQYRLFDTQGLPGGTYKVELQLKTTGGEASLRSDSVTFQLIQILDRSNEITITAPVTQPLEDALRIEGSIQKISNEGVQIEVRGPEGRIFGPQYIGTKAQVSDDSGVFAYHVPVTIPGTYEVAFNDSRGFIGIKSFTVNAPATSVPTTVPESVVTTTRPVPTTIPTMVPSTTAQSPLPPAAALAAVIGAAALFTAGKGKKR